MADTSKKLDSASQDCFLNIEMHNIPKEGSTDENLSKNNHITKNHARVGPVSGNYTNAKHVDDEPVEEAFWFASSGDYAPDFETDDEFDEVNGYDAVDGEEVHSSVQASCSQVRSDATLQRDRRSYNLDSNKFIKKLFTRIKQGHLEGTKRLINVLDLKGESLDEIRMRTSVDLEGTNSLSVLHVALAKKQYDIVEYLLDHSGRSLATLEVISEDCEKLTPLYVAIQQVDSKSVKLLIENGADYTNGVVMNKAYSSPWNELPLAGAIWNSFSKDFTDEIKEMLLCLVAHGADLSQARQDGNTLLHLIILQAIESNKDIAHLQTFLKGAFSEVVAEWWKNKKEDRDPKEGMKFLLNIENKAGLTPLTLAAESECPLYVDFMNWENIMKYSKLTQVQQNAEIQTYDITNVTSLSRTKFGLQYNFNSVMHVLAHNDLDLSRERGYQDISRIEPLKSIVLQKWNVYKIFYYLWGLVHFVHMLSLTWILFNIEGTSAADKSKKATAAITEKVTSFTSDMITLNQTTQNITRDGVSLPVLPEGADSIIPLKSFCALGFVVLPLLYIVFEIYDFYVTGRNNTKICWSITGNGPYRILICLFSVANISAVILHLIGHETQDILLSLTLLLGWLYCIAFTRTASFPSKRHPLGTFSVMIQRFLFHDILNFIIIAMIVLISFTAAFHATVFHSKDVLPEQLNFKNTLFEMFKYYVAMDNGQDAKPSRVTDYAKVILSFYGIFSVILLVNMLIAAMNSTYSTVQNCCGDLVMRQKMAILLMLERRLNFQCLRKYSEKCFIIKTNPQTEKTEVFYQVKCNKL